MAHYVASGHDVHVLTCTLGEEGEVIPPELAHLASAHDDTLGTFRREELREAMRRLGVRHTVLGEDAGEGEGDGEPAGSGSRYRDSGMAGMPSNHHPRAFSRADPVEAATLVARHIRLLDPDVVVTYDEHGGYGHPDHIQAHRVTTRALALLASRAQGPGRARFAYQILTPRSWVQQDRAWLADHVPPSSGLELPPVTGPFPPSVVADERVSHAVVDPGVLEAVSYALSAHRTQVSVFDGYYALSNRVAARIPARDGYVRVDPSTGALLGRGPVSRHTGLLGETLV